MFLDPHGDVKGVGLFDVQHGDDKLDPLVFQHLKGLLLGSYLDELRRITEVQRYIFQENSFVDAPVFFQHEGIIGAGNEQDLVNPALHQQVEGGIYEVIFFRIEGILIG